MPLSCRFYSPKYPEVDDVVMVKVKSIAEMGAYAYLLEYDNIEGMILFSELSRRRIRSVNKLIRIGRDECVVVMRVEKEKGYIDLSKRRVSPEDISKCEKKYAEARAVNSILTHVAETLNYETDEQLEELYKKTAWHFAKTKSHSSPFESFKQVVYDPTLLDECGLDDVAKDILLSNIKRRLTQKPVKLKAEVECTCFGYEGIDAIKAALTAGKNCSTENITIKINLIASPLYLVTTTTTDLTEGFRTMEIALETIERKIREFDDGNFRLHVAPKVVSAVDEAELAKRFERLELENAEVSGDDDDDSEDGVASGEEPKGNEVGTEGGKLD